MSKNLPWVLAEWHNISSSAAPLKVDAVLFQDLKAVIDVIANHPVVQAAAATIKDLYTHVSDFDGNPHKLTVDQLPTKVIDVIYEAWRQEGYKGDLKFFKTLFFLYIQIIDYETLIGNLEKEDLIPSVEAVAKFIKAHNDSLDVHEDLIRKMIPGLVPNVEPGHAFFQYVGLPDHVASTYVSEQNGYSMVPTFDNVKLLRNTVTLIGCVRFLEPMRVFGIQGLNTVHFHYVKIDPVYRKVSLMSRILPKDRPTFGLDDNSWLPFDQGTFIDHKKVMDGEYDQELLSIDVTPFMVDYLDPDRHISIALVFTPTQMSLAVNGASAAYDIPGVVVNHQEIAVCVKPRGPSKPRVFFARMDENDPLQSFAIYRQAMSPEQLSFLFGLYQFPLIQAR